MTVAELIAELQKQDPENIIIVRTDAFGVWYFVANGISTPPVKVP